MTVEKVTHDEQAPRFETPTEHGLGVLDYVRTDEGVAVFTHTEVPNEARGHGIGSLLARTALDWARAEGLGVVPRCPFIAHFIDRNPEYRELVVRG